LNNKIAVCLDGSLPGYHFQKGFGSGSNNWVLHVEVFFSFTSFHVSNFCLDSFLTNTHLFILKYRVEVGAIQYHHVLRVNLPD